MKITIGKEALEKAVGLVQGFTTTRSLNPILSYCLLEAREKGFEISATDLEVGIKLQGVEGVKDIKAEGSLCLPTKKLQEILRELPNEDVELEGQETTETQGLSMVARCGKVRFKLFCLSPEEFPSISLPKVTKELVLSQKLFKELLTKVSFAISSDTTRPVLTGLLLELKDDTLWGVATDGKRLAQAKHPLSPSSGIKEQLIIPKKTVADLIRLLRDEGEVKILISKNQLAFSFDGIFLLSRLIEGQFPNWRQVIPEAHDKVLTLPTEEFFASIKRASVLTSDRYNLVRLSLKKGLLEITAETPELGDLRDSIEVDYKGEEVEIGFNPHFLIDALKNIDTESMLLKLKDSLSPGRIEPVGDEAYLYIVMPIKL